MTRNSKLPLLVAMVVGIALVTSACDIGLPVVDCSGIDQPDMGGLVCLGLNAFAIQAAALLIAVLIGAASSVV